MRRYHITHHAPRLMTPLGRMLLRAFDRIGCRHWLLWMTFKLGRARKLLLCIVLGLNTLPLQVWCQPTHYQPSPQAYQMIKKFEGFYPYTYLDAGGLPTIGFGHLIKSSDSIKEPLLGKDVDELLFSDVANTISSLNSMLRPKLNNSKVNAIVDFSFNLGTNAFAHSTLRKKINQNASNEVITQEFLKWRFVGNKPLAGLERRRRAEADLYAQ